MSRRGPLSRGVLSGEDLDLWVHVTRSVAPLAGRRPPKISEPAPVAETAPEPLTRKSRALVLPPWSPAPQAVPALPPLAPLERRQRQRLSRGRAEVDGVIDLHGMRQAEAHGALIAFLNRAHVAGAGVVVVVTGKGAPGRDPERGVLRRLVPHWLAEPGLRRVVIGFETAARGHGGEGALYVRIRRLRG